MKCINTSCQSTRIKVIKSADGNVFENGANLVGAAICAIGCLTPFHYAAGKAAQSLWKEGTKSVKSHISAKIVVAHGKKQNGHKKTLMFKYWSLLIRKCAKA